MATLNDVEFYQFDKQVYDQELQQYLLKYPQRGINGAIEEMYLRTYVRWRGDWDLVSSYVTFSSNQELLEVNDGDFVMSINHKSVAVLKPEQVIGRLEENNDASN